VIAAFIYLFIVLAAFHLAAAVPFRQEH